jgi:hypothetical protein
LNCRVHLHHFPISTSRIHNFNRQNLRIHDFNFMIWRFQLNEFTTSASWIHNFNFMNSKCSVCWKRAFTKLKSWILRRWKRDFIKLKCSHRSFVLIVILMWNNMLPFKTRLSYNIILLLWELKSHKEIAKRDFPVKL